MAEAQQLFASSALLPEGWAQRVLIRIDAMGAIEAVEPDVAVPPAGTEHLAGVVVPGMPNGHSHAFQRAMIGLAEYRTGGEDNFWGWRQAMYRLLHGIGPETLQAIGTQLYIEMLKNGYTGVAEFHYLHHNPDGIPYEDPSEMSRRLVTSAQAAGIHITLLPVLYCHSDFGRAPPVAGQGRFVHGVDDYRALLQLLWQHYRRQPGVRIGIAPHSLRAVGKPELDDVIASLNSLDTTAPIHIHVAEQEKEVERCLAHTGARPVAWLQQHFEVGERWCLIHATHLADAECNSLARSGAVAGLCPTTEANLGDGIFPALDYLSRGGHFAIGSDSQVSRDPAGELRLLEYGQRLAQRQRALLADESQPSVGEYLFRGAVAGGARALGIDTGVIRAGARADLLVLDNLHPVLYGRSGAALLDSWVFACNESPVRDVMVAGQWQVRAGRHPLEETVADNYRHAMDRLKASI